MNINRIDQVGQDAAALGATAQDAAAQDAVTLQPVVLEAVRYDMQTGLVPVVVQDVETGLVLMQAYANREALKRTIGTGQAWFWSRSRQEYWRKGATSGNVMTVNEIRLDCDGDSVLYLVSPKGPACHTGATTCYFRTITPKDQAEGMRVQTASPAEAGMDTTRDTGSAPSSSTVSEAASGGVGVASSEDATADAGCSGSGGGNDREISSTGEVSILQTLWTVLESRYRDRPQGSYTTYLFEHGVDKIAKKVGEEAVEVAIAAKNAVAVSPVSREAQVPETAHVSAEAKAPWSAVTDGKSPYTDLTSGQKELSSESADLLYHLLALWKMAGVTPDDIYRVLKERHG